MNSSLDQKETAFLQQSIQSLFATRQCRPCDFRRTGKPLHTLRAAEDLHPERPSELPALIAFCVNIDLRDAVRHALIRVVEVHIARYRIRSADDVIFDAAYWAGELVAGAAVGGRIDGQDVAIDVRWVTDSFSTRIRAVRGCEGQDLDERACVGSRAGCRSSGDGDIVGQGTGNVLSHGTGNVLRHSAGNVVR